MTISLREVAVLEEGRAAKGLQETAAEAIAIAGGSVGRGTPGTPENHAVGLGMAGPVSPQDFRRAVAFMEEVGAEPRFEVCPFADASMMELIGASGFRPVDADMVFFRELTGRVTAEGADAGIRVAVIDPADDALLEAQVRTVIRGFMKPGDAFPEAMVPVAKRWGKHPRTVTVGAWLNGELVGGGSMDVCGEVAALFGASVVEHARRKGVQQSMLAARISLGYERGARIASIGSRPGGGTERNVRRMGFQVAYTKLSFIRPGPGLAPFQH